MLLLCSAVPIFGAPDPRSNLQERAPCVFSGDTGAASAIANKNKCSTITLDNVFVPAGTTLDLTNLNAGTSVSERGNYYIRNQLFFTALCSNEKYVPRSFFKETPPSVSSNGRDLLFPYQVRTFRFLELLAIRSMGKVIVGGMARGAMVAPLSQNSSLHMASRVPLRLLA